MSDFSDISDDEQIEMINNDPQRRARNFKPRINFDLDDFAGTFRLSRQMVEQIRLTIGPDIQPTTHRNFSLTAGNQILLTLRFLSTGGFYKLVGHAHGLSESTTCRILHNVVDALNHRLFDQTINFPTTGPELRANANKFHRIGRIPGVLGCIDGTHIPIKAPTEYEHQYVNRKGFHSINTMAVVTSDYRMCYVSTRFPGATHDARVMRNSALCLRFDAGWRPYPGAILLGDSGYPLTDWLITPVRSPNPTEADIRFNRAHSRTRCVVERAFGIMKARFACLDKKLRVNPVFAAEIIKACCILHNYALNFDPDGMGGDIPGVPIINDPNDEMDHQDEPVGHQENRHRDRLVRIFDV